MVLNHFDREPDYKKALFEALTTEDAGQARKAWEDFNEALLADVESKSKAYLEELNDGVVDERILAARGLRRELTSQERKYFNEAVEKKSIEGLSQAFPETIVEDIFKDLTKEHPILSKIDTSTTNAVLKYIYGVPTEQKAFWGEIPADIRQILIGSFRTLNLEIAKLSGFIAIPKGYYKLGASWLANYVMTFLREVMTATLEEAVVNGDGKTKPIGMMRKLSGSVDGVYPERDKVSINDFKPMTLASIRALLAKQKTDNGVVEVLVNPETYWAKLFPALAFQTDSGAWVTTQLPTGETIVTSHAVPKDTLIIGVMKNYLLAVAANLEITSHPDTLAIEDMDLHVAKLFANGLPKHQDAFVIADISGVTGASEIANSAEPDVKREDNISPRSNKKTEGKSTPSK